ncbi:hypothetical protein [Actinoplanes derwentensis]|uniref:Uncharacterized protein n=1 Tax=Actinoplanes derwentensis TaxID=113562 RepID=A0A1H1VGL8_9ACTN|nr:hypothetical protein [Actinoplanes derwentensis]GID83702.1 hypothetical protein Ade03nite_26260 [Actinoplanes derwentensis]SDS83892.1 hypothetical protein SAMN04489716_1754 [Actinoplanes derwentensis]
MRTMLPAAVITAALMTALTPAPAQASPPSQNVTALLGTYGFGRAAVIGQAGRNAGVWRSYSVRSGFAGDDLTITYRPATAPSRAETTVYTAAFNQVKDAQGECNKVGADGVARRVWVSYRCRTGIVASYTLLVR